MRRNWVLPLAGAALAAAGAATAQTAGGQGGAGAETDHLTIAAKMDVIYDSNFARSSAAVAKARGLTQGDESYRPAATIDFLRTIGSQAVFLSGSAGYDFYGHDTILNTSRIDLTGGGDLRVASCHGKLFDEYTTRQLSLEEVTIQNVRNQVTQDTINFTGDCARTIGFTPTIAVSQTWSSNSNNTLQRSDFNSFSVSPGIAYQRPVFGRLSLFGRYSETNYPNNTIILGPSSFHQGYTVYEGGVSFSRQIGARIQGSVELAYTDLQPSVPTARKFSGLTYSVDASAQVTPRISALAHLERQTKPSLQLGSSYSRQDLYSGELDYMVNPRLKVAAGGRYEDERNVGANLNPTLALVSQTITDYFARVQLDFARRWSLGLEAREENRRASLSRFSYSGTRLTLTLAAHI